MKKEFGSLIRSKDLQDFSIDLLNKVLDNNVTNAIINASPTVKELVSILKIRTTISDILFIKKAMYVLLELGEVNWKDRTDFLRDLDDKDSKGSEKLLMHIEKLETIEKCKVFGRLCVIKALNKINKIEFLRLTKLIQDAFLEDMALVKQFSYNKPKHINSESYYHIISLGLIVQADALPKKLSDSSSIYTLSDLGKSLIEIYDDLIQ